MNALVNTAMIAHIHSSAWTGRKYDAAVSSELNASMSASSDASRVNKLLIDKALLLPLTRVIQNLRGEFYRMTLPWGEDGGRLMPATMYSEFSTLVAEAQYQLDTELDTFIDKYRDAVRQAAQRMGDMFSLSDYPTPAAVRSKFTLSFHVRPVPSANDFRLNLTEDIQQAIRANMHADIETLTGEAMHHLWTHVGRMIEAARDRLADPDARFRRGMLDNLVEVIRDLDKLNVVGDPDLTQLHHDAMSIITPMLDPDALRSDATQRKATADDLTALADQYSSLWS